MPKYLNRYFPKDVQKAIKHVKKYPTLVRVMQNKITMIYLNFTFTRMLITNEIML